jgi:hypothetical protein
MFFVGLGFVILLLALGGWAVDALRSWRRRAVSQLT